MDATELKLVLILHRMWRANEPGGKRADLRSAILRGADLSGADLSHADLCGADLSDADLSDAGLCGADLSGANLNGADLSHAILSGANLSDADLSGADLSGANLSDADLSGTCLDPNAPVPEIPDSAIFTAGLEIRGDQIWGWRTAESRRADARYEPLAAPYEAHAFSIDANTPCHPGIYFAGPDYVRSEYPGAEFVRCYCLRSELVHADKWRCKRLWVVKADEGSAP